MAMLFTCGELSNLGARARPGVTRGCCRTPVSGAATRLYGKKGVTVLCLLSDREGCSATAGNRILLRLGCDAEIYELKSVKTRMLVLVLNNVLEFFFFSSKLEGQLGELLLCACPKHPSSLP